MEIPEILLIDENKKAESTLLKQLDVKQNNIRIDIVNSRHSLEKALTKNIHDLVFINTEVKWGNASEILEMLSAKHPHIGRIAFCFTEIDFDWEKKKIKADAIIHNFGKFPERLIYAIDFAIERARERSEFSNINTEYQELFNSVPIGLYKTDYNGKIIHCNKYLTNLLGFEKESELLNSKIQDFMITIEQGNDPFFGLLKNSPLARGKVQLRKRDGSTLWTEFDTQATISKENILLYLHGSVRDITEKITLEDEIKSTYEKKQFYLDSADTYFVVINRDESIAFVNDKMAIIHDMTKDEMIGKNWIETAVTAESREKLRNAFNEIIKGNVEKYHSQELNQKLNGKSISIIWKNTFVKDKDGQIATIISSGTDITDLKKSKELLKESNEKYKKLIETSPDLIVVGDLNGIVTFANKQMFEFFMCESEEEIIGKNLLEFIHPDSRELASNIINETFSKGKVGEKREFQMVKKNGHIFPLEVNASVLTNSRNEPIGIISVGRDISERKEAEKEIFRNEAKFRQLFNMANDAIVLLKISKEKIPNEIIEVNTIACERYGYSRDELLCMSISDLVDPNFRSLIPENMANLFLKGITTHESLHITKDNVAIPVELSSHIFKFEKEEVVLSIIRDITERKKSEKALKNSEELYKSIFENTGTSLVVLDANNKIVICNSLFENLVGYSNEELVNTSWRTLIHENDLELLNKIAKERLSYSNIFPKEVEFRIVNKIGKIKKIWALVDAIYGTNQTVVSLLDITEKSIMEEVKKQAFDQIEKNMTQFAILVDSIRNPLSIIVGLSDIQNNEISRKVIEQSKLIDDIIMQLDQRWLESANVKNFLSEHL